MVRVLRLALLLATVSCPVAWAQFQWGEAANYVNITEATVQQLSNAVRITLKADGTIRSDVKSRDFWTFDPLHDEWRKLESKHLTINLLNARSQIGRYVGVGTYPASHITLSVPSEAKEGTGLEVTLSLFLPTCIGKIQDGDRVRDWSWDERPISVDMLLSENGR